MIEGKKQISKCMHSKCNVNGIMYNTSTALEIHSSHCYINNVYTTKRTLMFCRCNAGNVYLIITTKCALFCTQCLMELQLILVGSFVPV